MEFSTNIPKSALDFKGFGELKAKAANNQKLASKEVAQQFEAMFIQMMLKSMRAAVPKDEMNRSKTMETFEQMYDREIAVAMSRKGGLGLANVLQTHLKQVNGSMTESEGQNFQLKQSYDLKKKEKSYDLKYLQNQRELFLQRDKDNETLNFQPLNKSFDLKPGG